MIRKYLVLGVACAVMVGVVQEASAYLIFTDETSFLAATSGLSFESFEALTATNGTTVSTITVTDFEITHSDPGEADAILEVYDVSGPGTYATDGDNYVLWARGPYSMYIDFNASMGTIGFTMTDALDVATSGSIIFSNNAGQSETIAMGQLAPSNELFFGFIGDFQFTHVTIEDTMTGDVFGIDGVHYGAQVIPEPTTMLMLGGLGAGLASTRKLRRKKK